MSITDKKYVDAFADWDDRAQLFRVFLTSAPPEDDDEEPAADSDFLEAEHLGESTMARLYRAAFVACPKDIGRLSIQEPVGWSTEPPAKRVAKAVKAELGKIDKGEPGPTDDHVRWAAHVAKVMAKPQRW